MAEQQVLTGVRPTGDLSVANYVGAMKPIVEMQDSFEGGINLFVADLHGLTDQEPELIQETRLDTVRSFVAAGIDPERVTVYMQSQIEFETVALAALLDRHMSVAELLRVPTLKDKMKKGQKEENVTVALARYPILMAADIFIQDATDVPVGKDQHPHIEVARVLARRFNSEYGEGGSPVIVEPQIMAMEALRIMALNGEGKMSKSNPRGALFLKDSPDDIKAKIGRAQTAGAGEMTPVLESHFTLCEQLVKTEVESHQLKDIRERHMAGEAVMKDFKELMTGLVAGFVGEFQERYDDTPVSKVQEIIAHGSEVAQDKATEVLGRVKKSMRFA